jgi:prepilin signal peptidase PulO-like enzyme (type II secretory pathway)
MFWVYLLIIFFVGLCFGSFLNALVWRTWQNIRITHGRSMCPACHRQLAWYDNIPFFSFLMLGGLCRVCKNKISWQYPVVELSVGFLFVLIAWMHGTAITFITPEVVRDWALLLILSFIFLYDLNYGEILDSSTIPAAIVLFLFSWSMGWQTWPDMVKGILVGAGFFGLQYFLSKGKWVGGGDIRLGLLIGVVVGWPNIIFALGLAYVLGAIWGVMLMAMNKKDLKSEMPFGTYLAVATFITMICGDVVVNWYLSLLS